MSDYPKWHTVAPQTPHAQAQHEIDAIRDRLDAAGIPQVFTPTPEEEAEEERVAGSMALLGGGYPTHGEDSERLAQERYDAAKAAGTLPAEPEDANQAD